MPNPTDETAAAVETGNGRYGMQRNTKPRETEMNLLIHHVSGATKPAEYPGDLPGDGNWTESHATAWTEWGQCIPVGPALLSELRSGCVLHPCCDLAGSIARREDAMARDCADAMTPLILPAMRDALAVGLTVLMDISHVTDWGKCDFLSGYAAVNSDGTRGAILRTPSRVAVMDDAEAEDFAFADAGGIPDVD